MYVVNEKKPKHINTFNRKQLKPIVQFFSTKIQEYTLQQGSKKKLLCSFSKKTDAPFGN
jgi:hypothetical protein